MFSSWLEPVKNTLIKGLKLEYMGMIVSSEIHLTKEYKYNCICNAKLITEYKKAYDHGMGCGWRKRLSDVERSCECIE
jgi:hypothetical protein